MNDIKSRVIELDINDVLPNRFQPRVKFNEDAIIELSESIKEHGIIQPIIVRPIGDKYEIIAGERRYKASILAGKDSIPAIITDLNDKDSAEIALIENVQRKNLTPIEEAVSYKKILDMGYLTQEQLALKLGKSQSSIANKMRLLHLSDEVQEALIEEKISERHARSLLKLTATDKQNEMLTRIINERLTVRKTDEEIEKMIENSPVEEVDSVVNEAAFVNSNPGFVDVNRIESQAREISNQNFEKTVDINALLQPDTSRLNHVDTKPATKPTSIFNIFNKNQSSNEVKPEPVKESTPSIFDANVVQQPSAPIESIYKFEPLPNLDEDSSIEPVEFKTPTNNVFESIVSETKNEEKINSFTSIPKQSVVNEEPRHVEKVNPFADIEVIEPQMPTIDLSKFTPNARLDEKEEIIEIPKPQPSVTNQPVVETKTESIQSSPIIIADYDKQYDPVMPERYEEKTKLSFRDVLTSIRETTGNIEKSGFAIDTDEIDLGTEYRIIISIKKND